MKAAVGDVRFAPAPLPLPPRRKCGAVAMRCLCGLLAWPWLTMLAVVATAVGLSMFDTRMRDALGTADEASYIIAGPGLRHWTAVARSCVTAATVLGATCLGTSLLAVSLASGALRTSRCSAGCRPKPSVARSAFVYASAVFSYLVALALCAALCAATIGAVGAKAAEVVANYGATLTSQVATIGNSLATRAAPFASALGSGGGTLPASASCPSECFDAARYPFLNSKQCVCGRELFRFRDTMARAFDVAVVGVVGAGVAAAALVLLWGTTAAHAARVWQLRCRSSSAGADAASRARDIGDDADSAFDVAHQHRRTSADDARCGNGDALVEVAEWPHALVLPGVGSTARRPSSTAAAEDGGRYVSTITSSSSSSLPQGPQPWGPHAAYTWSYASPSPGHHERTRSL